MDDEKRQIFWFISSMLGTKEKTLIKLVLKIIQKSLSINE